MSLTLHNFETTEYTVVTTYESGHKAYSVAMTDCSLANDYIDRLKRGLFGPCDFAKVARIDMIKRTTTVKEEAMAISKF